MKKIQTTAKQTKNRIKHKCFLFINKSINQQHHNCLFINEYKYKYLLYLGLMLFFLYMRLFFVFSLSYWQYFCSFPLHSLIFCSPSFSSVECPRNHFLESNSRRKLEIDQEREKNMFIAQCVCRLIHFVWPCDFFIFLMAEKLLHLFVDIFISCLFGSFESSNLISNESNDIYSPNYFDKKCTQASN